MKAIKTFRDLMVFLDPIPLGKTGDFAVTPAGAVLRFPVIVVFIRVDRRLAVALGFLSGVLIL
jgi:hypothetical protein